MTFGRFPPPALVGRPRMNDDTHPRIQRRRAPRFVWLAGSA
jgi:hypothetical protein